MRRKFNKHRVGTPLGGLDAVAGTAYPTSSNSAGVRQELRCQVRETTAMEACDAESFHYEAPGRGSGLQIGMIT